MAKRNSSSARRTKTGGTRSNGRARTAGRRSAAGGRGSTRTAGGRTRTGGGGTTRAAGGSRSRGGSRSTTRTATGAARTATGIKRNRNRTARRTARTSERPDMIRRPVGQMSEQEKRRTAASPQRSRGERTKATAIREQNVNRTQETGEYTDETGRGFEEMGDQENLDEEELYQRTSDYRQQKRMEEDVFAPTIQKAHLWLKEIMDEIGTQDRHRAHTALKAVLQTLRDRLTVEEAVDLASQLPTLIRGIYFEGWKPSGKPIKYDKEEFISTVRGYFQNLSGLNHAEIIRAVFTVLQRHIAPGEINHLVGTMPEEFAEFWMESELAEP